MFFKFSFFNFSNKHTSSSFAFFLFAISYASESSFFSVSSNEIISIPFASSSLTTEKEELAKGLKIDNKEIKQYEIKTDFSIAKNSQMDSIREMILLNSQNPNFEINCPLCGEKLITRIAKLYDLEDNLILRPKARCSKCPFQLTD